MGEYLLLALAKTTNEAKLYQTILFWYVLNKAGKSGVIGVCTSERDRFRSACEKKGIKVDSYEENLADSLVLCACTFVA